MRRGFHRFRVERERRRLADRAVSWARDVRNVDVVEIDGRGGETAGGCQSAIAVVERPVRRPNALTRDWAMYVEDNWRRSARRRDVHLDLACAYSLHLDLEDVDEKLKLLILQRDSSDETVLAMPPRVTVW
jgi:hypothetical protein